MTSEVLALLVITAVLYHATPLTADSHFTNEWAAEISGGKENAVEVAKRYGYEIVAPVPAIRDLYVLKRHDVPHRSKRGAHHHTKRLAEDGNVQWVEQQIARTRVKRSDFALREDGTSDFNDPKFPEQWYIEGSSVSGNERVERGQINIHLDLQVKGAWMKGYTGANITLSVLDDGIEHNNTDLHDNYDPYASTDLNDNDHDPIPRYDPTNENKHGTRCAGEIAMVANNGKCGVGIAFNSNIGGVRMLDGKVTDSIEARALTFNHTHVDIYSASWGPNDDAQTLEGPGHLTRTALETGIKEGRNGKGVIYAWASGNGGRLGDNCNCDGYTSSIYTLSVSSASQKGKKPWYGERCSSTFATAYSSGNIGDHQVVSADLHNQCTTRHTGTSAAAPMAAGIFALLLEANPNLTWREVQHLVAFTSKMAPLGNEKGWYKNAAGFCVNLAFGFGLLDANALVTEGHPKNWVPVPNKTICKVTSDSLSNLPQKLTSGHYAEVMIETNGCKGQENEVNFLEHVQFVLTADYTKRGAISVKVTSPSGTETTLMDTRRYDKSKAGFQEWPLMSVHTWGEDPKGVWRFKVVDDDTRGNEHGMLRDVKMILHGTKEAPHYLLNGPLDCDITVATSNSTESSEEQTNPPTLADKPAEQNSSANHNRLNHDEEKSVLNLLLKNFLQSKDQGQQNRDAGRYLDFREDEEEDSYAYL